MHGYPLEIRVKGEFDALLLNSIGRRINPRGVQRLMDDLAIEAGLPKGKLTPHVLGIILQQGF